MQKKSSSKSVIILVVILVLLGGIYFYMSGSNDPVDDMTLAAIEGSPTSDASVAGARVLSLLNQINSLKIDSTFFTSPSYSSLVDHTVPIYDQSIGKPNPFYNPRPRAATTR